MSTSVSKYCQSGISAAGTTQATATVLVPGSDMYQISTCATGAGVKLPLGQYTSSVIMIRNDGASSCLVYPPSTAGKINSLAAGVAVVVPSQRSVEFVSKDGSNWYTTCNSQCPSSKLETISAARTMLAQESGQTFLVNPSSAYDITLPAPASGLYYKFVNAGPVAAFLVRVNAGAGLLSGNGIITSATPSGVVGSANQYFSFVASAPLGTVAEFVCDGTNWNCNAASSVAAKIAFS